MSSNSSPFNMTKYSLNDEELRKVELLLETITKAKDFGEKDMALCSLEAFLKDKSEE